MRLSQVVRYELQAPLAPTTQPSPPAPHCSHWLDLPPRGPEHRWAGSGWENSPSAPSPLPVANFILPIAAPPPPGGGGAQEPQVSPGSGRGTLLPLLISSEFILFGEHPWLIKGISSWRLLPIPSTCSRTQSWATGRQGSGLHWCRHCLATRGC